MAETGAKRPEAVRGETSYSKEQILASRKYARRRDLLSVILKGEKLYTAKEIEAAIEKFMKGKVN